PPPPHHLDLGLDLETEPPLDLGHHALDELPHVGRCRSAFVDDEVSVELTDRGRPLPCSLQPRRLDQAPCGIARRVFEDASTVLGFDRLCLVPLSRELRHELLRLFPLPPLRLPRG